MASTIEQIDAYLKKNKKPLFSNLNNWYGKNDSDANNLKFLWNAAQDARGINNKIEAFKTLQEELAHWTDLDELERQEAELTESGADNWTDPQAKVEMDKMRFFGQLSNTPSIDKLTDLSIDDAYSQGYDFEQMKALANEYGYDYTDKEDRKEFLDKLSEYQHQKDVEDIWNDDMYAGLVTPIAKEYAKQNYQDIDSKLQLAPVVAADVGVNTLMAGVPGGALSKAGIQKGGQVIANNIAAPVAKAGLNMALNDESLSDAAKDAIGEAATNFAFRFGVRGANRYANELMQKGKEGTKGAIQSEVNARANAARNMQPGIHYRYKFPSGKTTYYTVDKDGNPVSSTYKAWADDPNRLEGDLSEMHPNSYTYSPSKAEKLRKQIDALDIEDELAAAEAEGKTPEQMSEAVLNVLGSPQETFWNFAKNNAVTRDMGNYINNLQGRSKWGSAALGQLSTFDPTHTVSQKTFEKQPKLSKQDKAELELLQRLRDLHAKNPKLFKAPKIPDKFKDYFNEEQAQQWNENVRINDIF